jgi:hypothetical protein
MAELVDAISRTSNHAGTQLGVLIQVRILFPSQSLTKQADSEKANEKAADREEVAAA